MQRSRGSELEKAFYDFLTDLGYPEIAVVYEPLLTTEDGRRFRPDFLIIDPDKNERLAVIEIKGVVGIEHPGLIKQLQSYGEAVGAGVPVYLVTPSENDKSQFNIYSYIPGEGLSLTDTSLFPRFSVMKAEAKIERKAELRNEKNKVVDNFRNICFVLAGGLLLAVIFDFLLSIYGVVLITTERMALLGAVVALIVIPYAQKFKGLGMEWERVTKGDSSD